MTTTTAWDDLRSARFNGIRFSTDLTRFCDTHGLSWRELGRRSGVSPSTMTRVMRGECPAVDVVYSLAHTCGLDLGDYSVAGRNVPVSV